MSGETSKYEIVDPTVRNGVGPRGASAVNRIALSRAITFSGGNAAFIALLFILYRETDSAGVVALGALASFAIPALVSPVAGWLGDRYDRRKVMVTSELVGSACFLMSAALASSPAGLLTLRVLASLAGAPFISASAAALPGVVRSQDELPSANTKLAAAGLSGGLFGPLLAAGLIALSGPGSVFILNAVTFLISALLLVSIDASFRPPHGKMETRRVSDLVAGFRYLGQHRLLRPVTIACGITFVGVGLTAPAEVVLSSDFDAGASGFAAITGAFALGGIAGARLAGRSLSRSSMGPIPILVAASGALTTGFLLIGFAPLFAMVLAGMAIAGTGCGTWMVAHENLVQRNTPGDIRSRVFAGGEAVCQGGIAIGTIGAGGLLAVFGAADTFRIGAVGAALACALLMATAVTITRVSPKAPAGRRGRVLPAAPTTRAATVPALLAESIPQSTDRQAA